MINIAIDGPAGSGKSTVSKIVANKLNILHLDTGAMYRACALKCLSQNIDLENDEQIERVIENIDLKIEYKNGIQITKLDGLNVNEDIRQENVSKATSRVSSLLKVRKQMVSMQRKIASSQDCVLDGRDIASAVLPNADYKFFITASSMTRAERRYKENLSKGIECQLSDILQSIEVRDYKDSTRENSPLIKCEDAFEVDSSNLSIEEVVNIVLKKVKGERS